MSSLNAPGKTKTFPAHQPEQPPAPKSELSQRISLVNALIRSRRSLLRACWEYGLWKRKEMLTTDGRSLRILHPGYPRRLDSAPASSPQGSPHDTAERDTTERRAAAENPHTTGASGAEAANAVDFYDAQLILDGETQHSDVLLCVPPVEAAHARDGAVFPGIAPAHERPRLHVILHLPPQFLAAAAFPGPPEQTVLDAGEHLSNPALNWLVDRETALKHFAALPGRCALHGMDRSDVVEQIVRQAAEERARAKSVRIMAPLVSLTAEAQTQKQTRAAHWDQAEQLLFESLFQALGYRSYARWFRELARCYPVLALTPFLNRPRAKSRELILCRWFGALGLLQRERPRNGGTLLREYIQLRVAWMQSGGEMLCTELPRSGNRPWNAPERRLVGLFHHLYAMGQQGLMKGWLSLFADLDELRNANTFPEEALRRLQHVFATPAQEVWKQRVHFDAPPATSSAQLIGRDRVVIVLANAVIPFFLGWARLRKDTDLESLLYRLYLILPPEAPNRRTRYMSHRLLAYRPLRASLGSQQGLLQIEQDFCHSFVQGCAQCRLPAMLEASLDPPSGDL